MTGSVKLLLKHLFVVGLTFSMGFPQAAFSAQTRSNAVMNRSVASAGSESPRRSLSQNPKRAVEVSFKVYDAPGTFDKVEGVVQYDVSNAAQCGARDEVEGNIPQISSSEPISLSRKATGEYIGIIYLDQILDEDYYGNGVCHWDLTEVRVALVSSGDPQATRFVSKLSTDLPLTGSSQTRYFWSGYYPSTDVPGYVEFGNVDVEKVRARIPRGASQETFTTTLSAREIAQ